MKHVWLLIGCALVAREAEWQLLRCVEGAEVCYLHHQILPTDDRWQLSCFRGADTRNNITIPPAPADLKFHGR
jgi:hypothetical protein